MLTTNAYSMLFVSSSPISYLIFFCTYTSTTAIYTLSLHDALPIYRADRGDLQLRSRPRRQGGPLADGGRRVPRLRRSEEHTSELQSLRHLVCRLLLEKKKISDFLYKTPGSRVRV